MSSESILPAHPEEGAIIACAVIGEADDDVDREASRGAGRKDFLSKTGCGLLMDDKTKGDANRGGIGVDAADDGIIVFGWNIGAAVVSSFMGARWEAVGGFWDPGMGTGAERAGVDSTTTGGDGRIHAAADNVVSFKAKPGVEQA
jgi:hypothetical protein